MNAIDSGAASAPAVLAEIGSDSGPLLDVYEAFCARRENGELIDVDAFCAEFPAWQSRLGMLVQAHLHLEKNASLLADSSDVAWPECGQTFLDYQMLMELGRGAFARVYLATEARLGGRLVALKVSWLGGAEAEILGRLLHPNIVPVHSVQTDPHTGLTVVCMPYLGSVTIAGLVTKVAAASPLPARAAFLLDAVKQVIHPLDPGSHPAQPAAILQNGVYADGLRTIGAQLADALDFLHERGIYHQDLKPSNVVMTPVGTPMLLDFNLSADAHSCALLGGTLPYMAPELLQAQRASSDEDAQATAQSDLFSLGVILFELATGTHPFGPIPDKCGTAALRDMLLERIQGGAPSVRAINPAIDPALASLIERCLCDRPQDRPESAAEVAGSLRRQLTPAARTRRFLSRHPRSVIATLCLAAVLAVAPVALQASRPSLAKRQYDAGVEMVQQGNYKQAVANFSAVLEADASNAEALIARANTFVEMGSKETGYYQSALTDYLEADKIASDWRTKAGVAYCVSMTGAEVKFAIENYQASLDVGKDNAAIRNNLGFCLLKFNKLNEAEENLNHALELDPKMQAAYHNRALLHLQFAFACNNPIVTPLGQLDQAADTGRRQRLASRLELARADIARAINMGPASTEVYFDAARIYGFSASFDSSHKKPALMYLKESVDRGSQRKRLTDFCFTPLNQDDAFVTIATGPEPSPLPTPTPAIRIINPAKYLRQ